MSQESIDCSNCGADNHPEYTFCRHCRVPAPSERPTVRDLTPAKKSAAKKSGAKKSAAKKSGAKKSARK